MDIYWFGHACFRLRSPAANTSVITDPFQPDDTSSPHPLAAFNDTGVVTVSRDDPAHNHTKAVPGTPRIFSHPGEYETAGIAIRAAMTPIPEGTPRAQRNVANAITLDGLTVFHLGGINLPLPPQQIQAIGPIDVLIAPAGGPDTPFIDHRTLGQMARQLEARIVIPMLFSTDEPNQHREPAACQSFLRDLGVAAGSIQPQNRLQITPNNLPSAMQVMLLEPAQNRRPNSRTRATS